jgi:hypothetical protein
MTFSKSVTRMLTRTSQRPDKGARTPSIRQLAVSMRLATKRSGSIPASGLDIYRCEDCGEEAQYMTLRPE